MLDGWWCGRSHGEADRSLLASRHGPSAEGSSLRVKRLSSVSAPLQRLGRRSPFRPSGDGSLVLPYSVYPNEDHPTCAYMQICDQDQPPPPPSTYSHSDRRCIAPLALESDCPYFLYEDHSSRSKPERLNPCATSPAFKNQGGGHQNS